MRGKYYPSWRYHKSLEPKLVKDADEDKTLGEGWFDTPAKFPKEGDGQADGHGGPVLEKPKKQKKAKEVKA